MSKIENLKSYIDEEFTKSVVPALVEYVKVPNQSPLYDSEFYTNGYIEKAMIIQVEWLKTIGVQNMKYEIVKDTGRTPFLFIEIDGTVETNKTVMMYGHMDKQPPLNLDEWESGTGPYTPVIKDGKLYGRGAADDGYSIFSAILAIVALQKHNIPHSRIVVTIESGEESGSPDIEHYVKKFKDRMGDINLIVCLDSGCQTYDRLWLTASLRGICVGDLSVKTLQLGIHSGSAGGLIPDSFRIARKLLSRIEDVETGKLHIPEAYCEIPESVKKGMEPLKAIDFSQKIPLYKTFKLEPAKDNLELAIKNYWEPSLTVTGDNLPTLITAGNLIRPETVLKLSVRCPPAVNPDCVLAALKTKLEADPPYDSTVTFESKTTGVGFAAPELKPWLANSLNSSSLSLTGNNFGITGEGGSIPFMGMLLNEFKNAQFVVTGVLGPASNAHAPNEFLHIDFCKMLTTCISQMLADHYKFDSN